MKFTMVILNSKSYKQSIIKHQRGDLLVLFLYVLAVGEVELVSLFSLMADGPL